MKILDGMSCNLPNFNFKELIDATIMLMIDPKSRVVLIPDSPTGASIIEMDFAALCENGVGSYSQRCTYEIDGHNNIITITSLPLLTSANSIREKIADIKERNGLPELLAMHDKSGKSIDIELIIRDDVNPYKFMKKLIKEVSGLEKSYPVTVTITNNFENFDWSIKRVLLEWINWRREQKRIVVSHKRTTLLAEQRTNDVKIFLMDKDHLEDTVEIFRTHRNRKEIEDALIEKYRNSEIKMDSLQARALSNLHMIELSIDAYESCLARREEIKNELKDLDETLSQKDGIDRLIIAELRDGIKRFGHPRRSSVVPYNISVTNDVEGFCILQLSSDGMINRVMATNVNEEPVPADNTSFAIRVENDASFILIDELGYHTYIKVKDLPLDSEVPVNRYCKKNINGKIVAMLPVDIEDVDLSCTLISKFGQLKRIRISDIGPSKKPCITLDDNDKLVKGIITKSRTVKDILVYTSEGYGQRLAADTIRITSPTAKGNNGFKLKKGDEIVGCYAINPTEAQYIVYVTARHKMRRNLLEFLPSRETKHDSMVRLLELNDRDKLVSVVGCNKLDSLQCYFNDGTSEIVKVNDIVEGTMSSEAKKITKKNAVSATIVKVKIV